MAIRTVLINLSINRHFSFRAVEENKVDISNNNNDTAQLCELIKNNFQLESLGISYLTRKNALEQRAEQLLANNSVRVGSRWQTCLL